MDDSTSLEEIVKERSLGKESPSKYMSSLGNVLVFQPEDDDQDSESVKSKSSSSTDSCLYKASAEQIAAVSPDMLRRAVISSSSKIVVHSSSTQKSESSVSKPSEQIRKSARSLEASFEAVADTEIPSASNGEPRPITSVQTRNESKADCTDQGKPKRKISVLIEEVPSTGSPHPEKATRSTRKSTRLNSTEVASPGEAAVRSSSDDDFERPRRSYRTPVLNNTLPVKLPRSKQVSKKIAAISQLLPKPMPSPSIPDSTTPRRSTRTSIKPPDPPAPRVEPRPRRTSTRHLSLNDSVGSDASVVGAVATENVSTKTPTRRSKRNPETPVKTPKASTRKKQKLSSTIDESIMEEEENSEKEEGTFVKLHTRKKTAGRKSRALVTDAPLNRERTPSPVFHLWPIVQP